MFYPKYVYKYMKFNDYWKDILINLKLYMARPESLNDPFEGQLVSFDSGTAGNSINRASGKFNKDVRGVLNQYRLLSLSANIRNKAMWAHYADDYSGFAIQFNTRNTFSKIERVIYKPDYEEIPCTRISNKNIDKNIKELLLYKSKDWENEEEFRIISEKMARSEEHYFPFNVDDVDSIIIGINIANDNKKELIRLAQKWNFRIRYMWTVPIKSRIEFYTDGNCPRLDGSSYTKYIDNDI